MKERTIGAKANLSTVAEIKNHTQASAGHTPATSDSEAIAGHIKVFAYKPQYSKRVLNKYRNLYTAHQ